MQSELIDLKKPRIIVIEDRGHTYTLTLSQISRKQWLDYFAHIVSTSETQNGKRTDAYDSNGARLALATQALIDADGYKVAGDGRVTDLDGWRELIPANHRLTAGIVLTSVERPAAGDDDPITLGSEIVTLSAVWGRDGNKMLKHTGLHHQLKSPSVEQQRRYSRDTSRSQIVGGSRSGKTRWLGAQATLAEIYDELIISVSGYTVNGEQLTDDRDAIVANMDMYHKVAAAEGLFVPVNVKVDEDEDA
ncbi:MAG: hypothetical protein BGO25_05550 [Acidobacteriales bacterium 59-55]|nr:hypothetical protein [Terriglobales bacterium]OJV44547.1 MAG: hypothetical protein BGO25_05550 [Acidobacteriales bacterium 59-55]